MPLKPLGRARPTGHSHAKVSQGCRVPAATEATGSRCVGRSGLPKSIQPGLGALQRVHVAAPEILGRNNLHKNTEVKQNDFDKKTMKSRPSRPGVSN